MAIKILKKIFILLMLFLVTFTSTAQTISFLGVPLSGTINIFTQKLALKGTKVNRGISSKLEDGMRAFDVTFFPHTCQALVLYNTSTRNVYEAVLMFHVTSSLNEFSDYFNHWSEQINDKYSKGIYTLEYEEEEYKSYPAEHYTIYSSKNNKRIGEIYLYMDVKEYSKVTEKGIFSFQVMYRNSEAPSFDEQMQDFF